MSMFNGEVINILGTPYKIISDNYNLIEQDRDGVCDVYEKTITIRTPDKMLNDADNFEIKVKRYNEVLRHEIIHAMFYESGLMEYCDNEELVNYIAMQTPKLFDIFNSLTIC